MGQHIPPALPPTAPSTLFYVICITTHVLAQRTDAAGQGTARGHKIRWLHQPALCTAKAGEVASIKEQQDAMALREAELSPHAGSGAWLSPALLPGLMRMEGMEA